MKRSLLYLPLMLVFLAMCILPSCSDEDERPTFPLTVEIFYSTNELQAAFTAVTHSAVSWSWDFGDGNTSSEKNPVHVYEEPGKYPIKLTVTGANGNSITKETEIALALPPFVMLAGDPTEEGYQGKTWKLSPEHDLFGDYFGLADPDFTEVEDMSPGILGLIGFGDAYLDEFTFRADGSYTIDVKDDGASFGGLVFQMLNSGDILNSNADFGLCMARYTPESDGTFTFEESEDVIVPAEAGDLKFEKAMTLDFSGTGYLAFRDFRQKVIITQLTNDRMQIIAFMATGTAPEVIGISTYALFLTLEAVN